MFDAHTLAHSYLTGPILTITDADRRDLIAFIAAEYGKLVRDNVDIVLCDDDPYPDHDAMRQDVLKHHRIKVYTGGTSSPLLSDQLNIMFRVVHDWHHVMCGGDFTLAGEIKAFQHACTLTQNDTLHRLFFSEIVLQAATFYATGMFPEQRIVDSPLYVQYSPGG
jgi:hypothetical protein